MNEEDVVRIHNGVLVIKKNKIMTFAATWMGLEIIIWNVVTQKEKDNYQVISLLCEI